MKYIAGYHQKKGLLVLTLLSGLALNQVSYANPEHSINTLQIILGNHRGSVTGRDLVELVEDLGGKILRKEKMEGRGIPEDTDILYFTIPNFKEPEKLSSESNIGYPGDQETFDPYALLWITTTFERNGITAKTLSQVAKRDINEFTPNMLAQSAVVSGASANSVSYCESHPSSHPLRSLNLEPKALRSLVSMLSIEDAAKLRSLSMRDRNQMVHMTDIYRLISLLGELQSRMNDPRLKMSEIQKFVLEKQKEYEEKKEATSNSKVEFSESSGSSESKDDNESSGSEKSYSISQPSISLEERVADYNQAISGLELLSKAIIHYESLLKNREKVAAHGELFQSQEHLKWIQEQLKDFVKKTQTRLKAELLFTEPTWKKRIWNQVRPEELAARLTALYSIGTDSEKSDTKAEFQIKFNKFKQEFEHDKASSKADTNERWSKRISTFKWLVQQSSDPETFAYMTDIFLDDFRSAGKMMFKKDEFLSKIFSIHAKGNQIIESLFAYLIGKNDERTNEQIYLAVLTDQVTSQKLLEQIVFTMSETESRLKYPFLSLLKKIDFTKSSGHNQLDPVFNAAFSTKFSREKGFTVYFRSILMQFAKETKKNTGYYGDSLFSFSEVDRQFWLRLHQATYEKETRRTIFKDFTPSLSSPLMIKNYLNAMDALRPFLAIEPELASEITDQIISTSDQGAVILYSKEFFSSLIRIPEAIVLATNSEGSAQNSNKTKEVSEGQKTALRHYFESIKKYYRSTISEGDRISDRGFALLFGAVADYAHLDPKLRNDLIDFASDESIKTAVRNQILNDLAIHAQDAPWVQAVAAANTSEEGLPELIRVLQSSGGICPEAVFVIEGKIKNFKDPYLRDTSLILLEASRPAR